MLLPRALVRLSYTSLGRNGVSGYVVGITGMSSLSRRKISYVCDMYVCKRWFSAVGSAVLSCLGVGNRTRTERINTYKCL